MKRKHRKDFYKLLGDEWDLGASQTGLSHEFCGKLYGYYTLSYSDKIIVYEENGQFVGCSGYGGFHKRTFKRMFWKFRFNLLLSFLNARNKLILNRFYLEEDKAVLNELVLNNTENLAELTILIVNEKYRGQHIGSKLYNLAITGVRQEGFDVLSIYTTTDECNYKFYEYDKDTKLLEKKGVQNFYSVRLEKEK